MRIGQICFSKYQKFKSFYYSKILFHEKHIKHKISIQRNLYLPPDCANLLFQTIFGRIEIIFLNIRGLKHRVAKILGL